MAPTFGGSSRTYSTIKGYDLALAVQTVALINALAP
jgi:hypothetical protein